MMRMEEVEGGVESSLTTSSSRCKDCGNQAKRDCEHMRCRTCCKSRGFQCQTHVKSTWVPVSRRRPRHLIMHHHHQISPSSALLHDHHHHHNSAAAAAVAAVGGPNPKRYRDNNNNQAALGLEEGDFPGEVSFPAVFRCVRVSSIDNVVDQYAYQTSVSIGGHVFTGILYDQGAEPEGTVNYVTGGSSSSGGGGGGGIGLLQQHNFVGGGGGGGAAGNTGTTPSSYPTPSPFYAFTSSQFFQYPKS